MKCFFVVAFQLTSPASQSQDFGALQDWNSMGKDPKLFYMLKYLGILWYEWQDRQQAAWGDGMLGPTLCGDSGRATFPSLVPCPEFLWTACLCS